MPTTFTYGIIIPFIKQKTKYRKQLSKMETHFAGFLFSKKLEKRTLWLKLLLKQYPSFTTLWSWLFIFTLNLLTQIHIWQLFVQYSSLYVIYGFLRLTKKSAKSLESIKFCRYISWNLAESIQLNLISRQIVFIHLCYCETIYWTLQRLFKHNP